MASSDSSYSTWICDRCNTKSADRRVTFHHCRQCKVDFCKSCVKWLDDATGQPAVTTATNNKSNAPVLPGTVVGVSEPNAKLVHATGQSFATPATVNKSNRPVVAWPATAVSDPSAI